MIALTSISGAPGVSTTAVGWALHSPRPTLIVEADTTGGSPILAGLFRGGRSHVTSITALTLRPEQMSLIDHVWSQAVALPEHDDRYLLPGISESAQAGALTGTWPQLAAALTRISDQGGYDVLIDVGRATAAAPAPLLRAADVVVVNCWSHLPGLHVLDVELGRIRTLVGEVGQTTKIAVLPLTPPVEGFSGREIARRVAPCPVLPQIPWAPLAAATLHQGAALPRQRRARTEHGQYIKALTAALDAAREHAASYHEQIGGLSA